MQATHLLPRARDRTTRHQRRVSLLGPCRPHRVAARCTAPNVGDGCTSTRLAMNSMRKCSAILWALLLSVYPALADAQGNRQVITATPACGACGVSVRPVATLDHREWNLAGFIAVAGRAGGRFFVAPTGPTVYAFDSRGQFQRTLGRRGQGPGEFQIIRRLHVDAGDSLLVFDELRRYVKFGPDDAHVRTQSLTYTPTSAASLRDGRMVLAVPGRSRSDAGVPLHLVSPTGQIVRSFGANPPILDPAFPALANRVVAAAADGTVWSVMVDRYVLERWDQTGRLIQRLERPVAWFPPPQKPRPRPKGQEGQTRRYKMDAPPASRVRSLQLDQAGHLWVLSAVADPLWASREVWLGEGESLTSDKMDQMYDSMLEEVDPTSGAVLSSLRLPQYIEGIVGRGTLAALVDRPSGERVVQILEFSRFPSSTRSKQ